jgi:hypothetical protein
MANDSDLWKGFGLIFLAGAVFSWAIYGVGWGLIYLVHHICWR